MTVQQLHHDEVTAIVGADPLRAYALVADVTRTPELSPEVVSCTWLDGASGPAVGARFRATNRVGGGRPWRNRPVVTVADPGREFAFARTEPLAGTVVWRYRFAPEGSGTRVTESYEVVRPLTRLGWVLIERVYGGRDRRAALRAGMEQTLRNLDSVLRREVTGEPDRTSRA